MARFEVISKYKDAGLSLPSRGTADAAGYDFVVAEDTLVPSMQDILCKLPAFIDNTYKTLDEVAALTKKYNAKVTLVPTGMKCYLDEGQYLELSVRSSTPLKHWLVLGNGVGIIDRDYADNPTNEGAIYFQLINLSPYNILLRKGDKIGQGIIKNYQKTENDAAGAKRIGGFGSTSEYAFKIGEEK